MAKFVFIIICIFSILKYFAIVALPLGKGKLVHPWRQNCQIKENVHPGRWNVWPWNQLRSIWTESFALSHIPPHVCKKKYFLYGEKNDFNNVLHHASSENNASVQLFPAFVNPLEGTFKDENGEKWGEKLNDG